MNKHLHKTPMSRPEQKNTPPKKKRKLRLKASIRRVSRKTLLVVLTIVLTVMGATYLGIMIVFHGPSPTFTNLVVSTMMETRRGDRIAHWFFTNEELAAITAQNNVSSSTSVTLSSDEPFDIPEAEKNDIQVIDVSGSTYQGKLMIVRDPSRIQLGVNTLMGTDAASGFLVEDYVKAEGAVAGINAGGFDDPNGQGDGSIPQGVVVKDGQLVAGSVDDYGTVIGFNANNHLIVGDMTGQQALDWGLTDAVTFGPVLIVNGQAVAVTGTGGGLNPRTVIGQADDGSVLLLVIDGRQTTSLGASYEDCIKIMLQYKAVNAANLDGGSSSVMVYNGQIINSVVSMRGDRTVPTAWIVK